MTETNLGTNKRKVKRFVVINNKVVDKSVERATLNSHDKPSPVVGPPDSPEGIEEVDVR